MSMKGGYRDPVGVDLSRAALVVVDVANDFAHPDGAYARHGLSVVELAAIVPPIASLITAFSDARLPTVAVIQQVLADWDGTAVAAEGMVAVRPWLATEGLRGDTWGTQLLEGLPPVEFTLGKLRASGFLATPLDLVLRWLGVETVVVVGGYTNQCVESTVRDAWALGYRVVVPPDATAAFDRSLHEATMQSLRPLTVQLPSVALRDMLRGPG